MKYYLLLLGAVALSLSGCASGTNSSAGTAYDSTDANGNPVSSTPWSKPESWEQNGQLGNAMEAAGAH
jgi:hypothetical protein